MYVPVVCIVFGIILRENDGRIKIVLFVTKQRIPKPGKPYTL